MRGVGVFLALLLMTLFSNSGFCNVENKQLPQGIHWQDYTADAFDQAKSSKHFIFLYGKSKSCHWCQLMDKTTWQTPAIINIIQTNFIPVLVDVDVKINIAIEYRMTSLPTMIILDADNHIIKIFSGYITPDIMEKNLNEIVANSAHPSIVANNAQPEVIKDNQPVVDITLLSNETRDQLKKKQISLYANFKNNMSGYSSDQEVQQRLDVNAIEYALILSAENEKLMRAWITAVLNSYQALLDPVWGGIYSKSKNGDINFAKKTVTQAEGLQIFSESYAYWQDPVYLATAKKLINYIDNFLTSPEGVFYAGVAAYSTTEKQNSSYYLLDDPHRRLLGMPQVDQHIYARDNGLVITGLVNYYMVTGDNTVLEKALKATRWVIDNLSVQHGGYRHDKTTTNIVYLNDTLSMGNAFLALYKVTTNLDYLNRAVDAFTFINKYFQNSDGKPGFVTSLDLSAESTGHAELNAAENADVVRLASLLFAYTGDKTIQQIMLSSFHYIMTPAVMAANSPDVVLLAEDRVANHPIHIVIVGSKNDTQAKDLYKTALEYSTFFSRVDWWDRKEGPMQNSDAEYAVLERSAAYVCYGFHCSFPIYNSHDLLQTIHDVTAPSTAATNASLQSSSEVINPLSSAEKLLIKKNWFLIVVGFIGFGFLLSFTPCILPLVPIMASIIVGQTIGVKKEKTFLLCLCYVLSMSFTYALLGLLAGAFGIYLQVYMQQTWIIVLFSLIFLVLALSMLDAYEIRLPRVVLQKINSWSNLQKGGTFYGVIVMGSLSTLIVSPCVSAPLAGVLSFITKTSDYTLGAVGLFCMSFGMGLPLLIISLFSKNILPKVTHWNKQIKTFFGLVLLGLSIWVVSRVIPDVLSLLFWSAFIIFLTIYMGILKRKTKNLYQKIWKTLTIMTFVYGVALLFNALFINSDLYRTLTTNQKLVNANQSAPLFKVVKNKADLLQAFNEAKESHLPILLDFSAKWCSSCVKMDRDVLSDPRVMIELKKFLLYRVDLTNVDSDSMALAREFNIVGPPIVLFFDEHGQLINLRATGDLDVEQFNRVLEHALGT